MIVHKKQAQVRTKSLNVGFISTIVPDEQQQHTLHPFLGSGPLLVDGSGSWLRFSTPQLREHQAGLYPSGSNADLWIQVEIDHHEKNRILIQQKPDLDPTKTGS